MRDTAWLALHKQKSIILVVSSKCSDRKYFQYLCYHFLMLREHSWNYKYKRDLWHFCLRINAVDRICHLLSMALGCSSFFPCTYLIFPVCYAHNSPSVLNGIMNVFCWEKCSFTVVISPSEKKYWLMSSTIH